MFKTIRADIRAALKRTRREERLEVFFTYSGLHALVAYRIAHFFIR